MKKLSVSLLCLLLCSCWTSVPTSSQLAPKFVLGDNLAAVMQKAGNPFRKDSYIKGGVKTDVLYYKELTRVDAWYFIVTSELTFENGKLAKITQTEKSTDDKTVVVDSIHK